MQSLTHVTYIHKKKKKNTRYIQTIIPKQKIARHGERESNLLLQIILPHEKKLVSSNEKKKKKFTYITREKASRLIYLERYIGWYILIYLEKHIGRYK